MKNPKHKAESRKLAAAERHVKSPQVVAAGRDRTTTRMDQRTVLLAVSGMSPAILTETAWALAYPVDGQDCEVTALLIRPVVEPRGESAERQIQ